MQGHSQPPADAVPLAEADPYIANTLRWRRRQRTSTAFVVPPEKVFIIERPITDDEGRRFTPAWASDDLVEGARALERRLARGDLLAWGREGSPWGPWRAIEPYTWGLLTIEDLEQGIVSVAAPSEARLYSLVVRKTDDDSQSVPPPPTNEETTTIRQSQSKRYPPEKVEAWYLRRVESREREGYIPSRDDDLRDARAAFPNINREQVRDARSRLAPDDWKKAGSRRKDK